MFWENVFRRLTAVGIFIAQANRPHISTVAKSSYYRAAIILLGSVVEGLVYRLVKKHTNNIGNIVDTIEEHKRKHIFPKNVFGTVGSFYLCMGIKKDIHIDDNGVTFDRMNDYLRHKNLITKTEWKALNKVRLERNKIHLQSLQFRDTGYTRSKVIEMSKPVNFLLNKL